MFAAGLVKLASGDVLWRSLTALTVHYETQPLPTPLAFHAHHLPVWAHEAATAGALAIELIAPWFILGPRRLRHVACGLIVALQIAIALTGNYTFFNLLTIALALTLVDDDAWPRSLRPRTDREQAPAGGRGGNWAPQLLLAAILTIVTIPLSTGILAAQAGVTLPWHATLRPVQRALSPFRSLNPYGLFAVMTHVRPEIIIEGSADGETWRPYEFKYKPALGGAASAPARLADVVRRARRPARHVLVRAVLPPPARGRAGRRRSARGQSVSGRAAPVRARPCVHLSLRVARTSPDGGRVVDAR
jgi:hypothetical protein